MFHFINKILKSTFCRPDMNRCSFSEDETTKALFSLYQGHSLDAQNNLQNVSGSILVSGTGATLQHPGQRQLNNDMHAAPGGKKKVVKEISNSSNKEGVSQSSHSIKKNPQSSVKSRSLNDVNKSPVVSEADAPGEKHKNKPRMPEYNSDRGYLIHIFIVFINSASTNICRHSGTCYISIMSS